MIGQVFFIDLINSILLNFLVPKNFLDFKFDGIERWLLHHDLLVVLELIWVLVLHIFKALEGKSIYDFAKGIRMLSFSLSIGAFESKS